MHLAASDGFEFAVTAQIAAVAPPSEDAATIRARRMAYYKAMPEGPQPSIAAIEDIDYPNPIPDGGPTSVGRLIGFIMGLSIIDVAGMKQAHAELQRLSSVGKAHT